MGLFKNIRENMRMAKYLREYDTLSAEAKAFYSEEEFTAEISKDWGLQRTYEDRGWSSGWPFESAKEIPYLAQHIKWARSEGATDEDIAWWWNLSPLDRILIKGMDHGYRRMALADFHNKGLSPEESLKKAIRFFSVYSEEQPDLSLMTVGDKKYYSSKDRPLPIELHDRVDIYLKNNSDPDNSSIMKKEVEECSSFNAFIREKIKIEPQEADLNDEDVDSNNEDEDEEIEIKIEDIPL